MFNEREDDVTGSLIRGFAGEHNGASMIQSDSLAPFQYYDSLRRKALLEPEKLLMAAVLEDAIDCYQRYATSQRRKWQRVFAEAEAWFMEEDGDWLFSFANICAVLGLSPGFIRTGLVRWKERHLSENPQCKVYKLPARRGRTKHAPLRHRMVGSRITARR